MANRNPKVEAAIETMQGPGSKAWQLEVARQSGLMPDEPAAIEDDEPIEQTPAERIMQMIGSTANDDRAVVKVYKVIGPNKFAWCDDYSPADFEAGGLAMLRRKWGVHEFQIRVYAVNPRSNQFQIRAKENIALAHAEEVAAPAPAAVPSELARMLETMAAQQAQLLQALTARPAEKSGTDQLREMLQLMALFRQANGADAQPKSQVSEIVAAMRELREASAELMPSKDNEPSDPLTAMLPGVLDMVRSGMAARTPQEPVQFPTVALPPALAAPVSSPVTIDPQAAESASEPQPQPEPDPMSAATLKMYLAMLLDMADKQTPAAEAAEAVYEKAPDEVLQMLDYPGWLDMLVQFEAKVTPHRAWFENVAAIVKEIVAEEAKGGAAI